MDETPATTIDERLIEIRLDGLPLDALDEWLGTMLVIRALRGLARAADDERKPDSRRRPSGQRTGGCCRRHDARARTG